MCKTKNMQRSFMSVATTTTLLGLLAVWSPNAAMAQCNPGIGDSIGVSGPYGNNYIHVGQNASINSLILFNSSVVVGGVQQICTATNVKTWVIYPDNTFQSVLNLNLLSAPNNILVPGGSVACPGDGRCLAFSSTYQVKLTDIGQGVSFSTNWPPSLGATSVSASGQPNTVLFQYAGAASMLLNTTAKGTAGQSLGLTVLQPCVGITKNCATNCTPYGQPIAFNGVITNCSVLQANPSDGVLFIASVVDNPATSISFATTTLKGQPFNIANGGPLPQGDSIAYSGSYQPTPGCGPFSDTITVIAADLTGFTVTNSATATCHVKTSPNILIQKDCHILGGTSKTLVPGNSYVADFTVQNTGDVPLQNAVIHDVDPLTGPVNITVGNLAVGQTVTMHFTNGPVTTANCGLNTDSATVTADSICPADATCPSALHVTNGPVSCSLTVACPGIGVIKQCFTNCTPYGQPILFTGMVTNTGKTILTNVTVTDVPAASITFATVTLRGNAFPASGGGTLSTNDSVTFSGNYTPTQNLCGPFTDTVTAAGLSSPGALPVSATNSATCHVSTAPAILIQKNCHVLLGGATLLSIGEFYVSDFTIQNTGNVPLQNAVIHDTDPLSGAVNITVGSLSIGQTVTVSYTNGPVTAANCGTNTDSAFVTADTICPADATCPSALHVTNGPVQCSIVVDCKPRICVTKGVICGPQGQPNPLCNPNAAYLKVDTGVNGAAFCYRIIVQNCGLITLTNVQVTDSQLGTLANFPTTLAPLQSVTNTYSKSYAGTPGVATTNLNVVNAIGTGNGIVTNAVDNATAIVVPIGVQCSIKLNSSLDVDGNTNNNHVTLPYSASSTLVGFALTVNNTGMADLSVSLAGLPPLVNCGDGTTPIVVPASTNIPAGGSVTISGCMLTACPGMTNQVTVQGTAITSTAVPCIYDSQGNALTTAPSSCAAAVECLPPPPKICVTKGVICGPQGTPNPLCDPNLSYLKLDTGVNGAAFCYRVIVENCGIVTLTNVQVTDTQLGTLSDFPTTLVPGQSYTNTYSKSYAGKSSGATTNVNVVNAVGTGNGMTTNAMDNAKVVVVPIGVQCDIKLSSSFDMDNNTNDNHVTLPAGTTNVPVGFTMTVCNTGMADLSVSLAGLPPLVDCADDLTPIVLPATTNIAAGGCITIEGCMLVSCPGIKNQVTVEGTAIASTAIPCIYNSQGNVITTGPSSCSAVVECQTAVSCRVTGGGTLYADDVSHNCIDVVTTLRADMADAAGLVVDHISHGGQLGAPFSQMDCATRLANPCIRGEWEHVRHYDNKQQGLQDVFDMNFHSANPNITGHFDTLMCACLPCCYNGTNYVGNKPAPPGWSQLKFVVCNPDDRKICGPLPRPAPANAIIFTGIGTFTPATNSVNGRKAAARYCVFRVYIEDRSEPGGIHPGGAKMPGTIYCFQAWDTGVAITKKAKFDTLAAAFRTALGEDSCAFMSAMSDGTLPPGSLPSTTVGGVMADVADQGPLHDGSQQIHPSTGSTCNQ